jgi:hypothetical protein
MKLHIEAKYNADGTITMLHGTTEVNAASIVEHGFTRNSDPTAVARSIELEFGLPEGSVLNHSAFQFAKHRHDLDHVHFTSVLKVAQAYTVPEQLQDALLAAFWLKHPHAEDANVRDILPKADAWVQEQAARLTKPEVLAVTLPWEAVGDHAFGRKIGLQEYLLIANGDMPYSAAIPLSALTHAKVCRATEA